MIMRLLLFISFLFFPLLTWAQKELPIDRGDISSQDIFDDRAMLEGYAQRFDQESLDVLLAMIDDDGLNSFKCAAAIRVLKVNFAKEILAEQKPNVIRILWHRLNRTDSPFVQVEIMHTLTILDRYQYFESMVTRLILKLDHYNIVVSDLAYLNLLDITKISNRSREARIVFNTLRKILFLAKNNLAKMDEPDHKLQHKIDLLRWSIKILGTQELKKLPTQVIRLL